MAEHPFDGSKAALFIGERLLIILRDENESIPYPNMWDFVGGGREGDETAEQTLIRETKEEVGLDIVSTDLVWCKRYAGNWRPNTQVVFFVVKLPAEREKDIVFGSEGQCWKLVDVPSFFEMKNVIPSYANRLRDWYRMVGDNR